MDTPKYLVAGFLHVSMNKVSVALTPSVNVTTAPSNLAHMPTNWHFEIDVPDQQYVEFSIPEGDMIKISQEQNMETFQNMIRMHTTNLFARTMAELNAPYIAKVESVRLENEDLKREVVELKDQVVKMIELITKTHAP